MTDQQQTPDRRSQRRSRCLKGGHIVLGNGQSTLACRIRNQSETGLRILLDEAHMIPSTFTLLRGGQDSRTVHQLCRLAWRSPGEIGAEVLGEQRPESHTLRLKRKGGDLLNRYPV